MILLKIAPLGTVKAQQSARRLRPGHQQAYAAPRRIIRNLETAARLSCYRSNSGFLQSVKGAVGSPRMVCCPVARAQAYRETRCWAWLRKARTSTIAPFQPSLQMQIPSRGLCALCKGRHVSTQTVRPQHQTCSVALKRTSAPLLPNHRTLLV